MYFQLLALACLTFTVNADNPVPVLIQQNRTIPFHNFTSLPEAIADVEKYILHFNETLNFPSLLFAFAVKGKPVMVKAYGIADLENGIAANVNNKYRIASISKSFTSAILGQLVDQKLVHYDDLVYKYVDAKYFPVKTFNGTTVNITLKQLLSHTAGIPTNDPMKDMFATLDPPDNVTQQILRFKDQQLNNQPGSTFEYANNGYQVLGAVIESITKKSFQDVATEFLKKYKFPAAMVGDSSKVIHNIPRYYSGQDLRKPIDPIEARSKNNFPACPYDDLVALNGWWPAGGLVATLDDLLHYGQLMIDAYKGRPGAILSKATLTEMWTGRVSTDTIGTFVKSDYAYGWMTSRPNDNPNLQYKKIVFHSGGILGLSSHLTIYPDEEVVGVTFANKGVIFEEEMMIVYAMENLYHLISQNNSAFSLSISPILLFTVFLSLSLINYQ